MLHKLIHSACEDKSGFGEWNWMEENWIRPTGKSHQTAEMKQASCQNIDLFQTDFGETVLAKQPLKNTRAHNNVRTAQSF